jgi:hypothetical protein
MRQVDPIIFVFALPFFLTALSAHIVHWRWKRPKRDVVALFVNFILIPAPLVLSIPFLPQSWSVLDLHQACAVYLLHFALSGVYISSYPVVQANSPSLGILYLFRNSGPAGLTRDEIFNGFDKHSIVTARVQDLVDSSLIKKSGNGFVLAFRGRLVIKLYILYRKSLGLDIKGG